MERHIGSMDTDELYRSAGIYVHTAVSLINKSAEELRVDPALSDTLITIGTIVLTVAASALFFTYNKERAASL